MTVALIFGENTYRTGAHERLEESRRLLDQGYFGGGIYLAGRAVEGMLRAVIWGADRDVRTGKKSLETGHDLRKHFSVMTDSGLLSFGKREDQFRSHLQHVSRLWNNNMRFAGTDQIRRYWRELRVIDARRTLKQEAEAYYNSCALIIKRCNTLW